MRTPGERAVLDLDRVRAAVVGALDVVGVELLVAQEAVDARDRHRRLSLNHHVTPGFITI